MTTSPRRNLPSAAFHWLVRNRLFILLGLTFAYFYQGGDPNQGSRVFLTRSIVERHAPDITPYHEKTLDKSEQNDRYYSDKAPTVSLLAVVPYALMNAADRAMHIHRDSRPVQRVRLHMLVIAISGTAGVVACFFLWRTLRLFGASEGESSLLVFGYGLGTLVFPFSTVLFGHQVAGALLCMAFYFVVKWRSDGPTLAPLRCAVLGLLWATSTVTEYPTALLAGFMGLYLLGWDPKPRPILRTLGWVAAGAALPLIVHSAFLWWAFGSPFVLPYKRMAEPIFLAHTSKGILGVGIPTVVGLFGSLISRYRGLFFYCPFLILTLSGFRVWLLSGEKPRERALTIALVLGSVLFSASYYAWDGGGSTGPRHIVPALPFFVVPMVYFVRRSAAARIWTISAIVPSVAIMLACTAVRVQLPEGDPYRANPLYEVVFASLVRGELGMNRQDIYSISPRADASYNLGTLLGLSPWLSIAALALVWIAAYAPSLASLRRRAAA